MLNTDYIDNIQISMKESVLKILENYVDPYIRLL